MYGILFHFFLLAILLQCLDHEPMTVEARRLCAYSGQNSARLWRSRYRSCRTHGPKPIASADSTEPIYSELCETGYKLRLIGFSRPHLTAIWMTSPTSAYPRSRLSCRACNRRLPDRHYSVRLLISEPTDALDPGRGSHLRQDRSSVSGKVSGVIKDVGDAQMVADKHGVRELAGTHGLGHARLPPSHRSLSCHPFDPTFPDVAIVHTARSLITTPGVNACSSRATAS